MQFLCRLSYWNIVMFRHTCRINVHACSVTAVVMGTLHREAKVVVLLREYARAYMVLRVGAVHSSDLSLTCTKIKLTAPSLKPISLRSNLNTEEFCLLGYNTVRSVEKVNRRFEDACCFHIQDRRISQAACVCHPISAYSHVPPKRLLAFNGLQGDRSFFFHAFPQST
jgi:hypothetical protein